MIFSQRTAHSSLSRTSSAMSFSSTSEDDASLLQTTPVQPTSRRTRKRFTNVQLTMLENLFHQNSHPSREEREAVAKAGGMEIKSVTIWFQNKRQTERKTAASINGQANTFNEANVQPNITSTIHTFSLHNDTHSTSRTASPPFSVSSRSSGYSASAQQHHPSATSSSSSSRPSLDRVASRSELRNGIPRTPSRRPHLSGHLYDSMPSSPLGVPISPPSRDFIDFGKNAKTRRTLEWACAAARLADNSSASTGNPHHRHPYPSASAEATSAHGHKNRGRSVHRERSHSGGSRDYHHSHLHQHSHSHRRSSSTKHDKLSRSSSSLTLRAEGSMGSVATNYHMDVDVTDSEEDHEAITPPSTWGKGDSRWVNPSSREGSKSNIMSLTSAAAAAAAAEHIPKNVQDDDMFNAALVLCGLGRRA